MRSEKVSGDREVQILIALATDQAVLAKVEGRWTKHALRSEEANVIAGWCVTYFRKYGRPVGKDILRYLERYSAKPGAIPTVPRLVADHYEAIEAGSQIASDYMVDLIGEYRDLVTITRECDLAKAEAEAGNTDKARERLHNVGSCKLGPGTAIDLFTSQEAVFSSFEEGGGAELFRYPDGVGRFFSGVGALERDSFLAFLAPVKSGKTFWLMDMAWRAIKARNRVAFFQVGDLSERQIKQRFLIMNAGWPYRSRSWPAKVRYPVEIEKPKKKGEHAKVKHEVKTFDKPLDRNKAWAACESLMNEEVRSKQVYFRMGVYPNFSMSVDDLKSQLKEWEHDGWSPDVVVVDYADLLLPPHDKARLKGWEQVDIVWRQLRALSQERHCMLLTATQSNAAGFRKETLDRTNFSGSARTLAHATGVVGINAVGPEKDKGICRLNWIALREGDFSSWRCVHVAQCLSLCNPCVLSVW